MKALVNKIIDFSTVDGVGLRTSVFLQGCNIHCLYCHNPETQKICNSCLKCINVCKSHALKMENGKIIWNKDLCVSCDLCIESCNNYSSPKVIEMTPEEVFLSIKKNIPFIRGITVSGGECMLYPKFLEELFILAKKEGLSCLLDSNGMVLYENYPTLMKYTDGVMLDVKAWDKDICFKLTGGKNDNVKRNLVWLKENNKLEEIRIVYVNHYVDIKSILLGIKELLMDIKDIKLKLIRFRNHGVKSILKDMESPSIEEMEYIISYAKELGYRNIELR